MSRSARRSELVVHAGAQEIGVERHVVGDEPGAAIQSAIEATEIDIEILDLGRPVGRESGLQPAPIVQPLLSLLVWAKPGSDALMLPNAAPPVIYGMKRSAA